MADLKKFSVGEVCSCGRVHTSSVKGVRVGRGEIERLPELIGEIGARRPFVISDENTHRAAGERVCAVLSASGIEFKNFVFKSGVTPGEAAVGSAVMHFDNDADLIITVGSGTLNDISKILSKITGLEYIIVATAPSMDGYASASSSMVMDGLKVSLPSRCPDYIIGDISVLCSAPKRMLTSGLGDMLAKYVSIAEWRISNIITGEYYCENIAQLVRGALCACTDNAEGLLRGEEESVRAVFEGLVICGSAMEYAGLSRPASGVEHYISHVWDMRGEEQGTPTDTHGIQCAIGTLISARLYENLLKCVPVREKAIKAVEDFSFEEWCAQLRAFLKSSAEPMILAEKKDRKYDPTLHKRRLEIIIENWQKICDIVREEIPSGEEIINILRKIDCPTSPEQIGIDPAILPLTLKATKDIRDKYVLSRLAFDLGVLDELAESI